MTDRNENKPGYKKTPVGWIPKNWETDQLGSRVSFLDSRRIPLEEQERKKKPGPFPYYGASGIIDYIDAYIFDDDLILLGEDGANITARSTPLAFRTQGKVWVNNHAHVIKVGPCMDAGYLCSYLESIRYEKYNTGSAQPKLNREICVRIPIPVPPLAEQKEIAGGLSTWDEAIEQARAFLDAKKRRKKALMQQLLTGKRRLPGFEEKWQPTRLSAISERIRAVSDVPGNHSVLSITAGVGFVSQEEKFSRVIAGKHVESYVLLRKGEFSYNKGNSYRYPQGCVYQLKEYDEGLVPDVFYSFRLDPKKAHDGFVAQFFTAGLHNHQLARWINTGVRNNGLLNLNASDFFNVSIELPPLAEQRAIADVLSTADAEIALLESTLAALEKQKRGLMQKLLTGEVRVKAEGAL